jgi:hypothetical protein
MVHVERIKQVTLLITMTPLFVEAIGFQNTYHGFHKDFVIIKMLITTHGPMSIEIVFSHHYCFKTLKIVQRCAR